MSDLKPCPFCGGDPEYCGGSDEIYVRCMACDAETYPVSDDTPDNIWNTRRIDPATKAQIEADVLRRVAEKFGIKSATDDSKVYCCALLAEADRVLKDANQ